MEFFILTTFNDVHCQFVTVTVAAAAVVVVVVFVVFFVSNIDLLLVVNIVAVVAGIHF